MAGLEIEQAAGQAYCDRQQDSSEPGDKPLSQVDWRLPAIKQLPVAGCDNSLFGFGVVGIIDMA